MYRKTKNQVKSHRHFPTNPLLRNRSLLLYPNQQSWKSSTLLQEVQQNPGRTSLILSLQNTCLQDKELERVWRMFCLEQKQRLLTLNDQRHLKVRYLLSLFKSLLGVYRNPQCNWECCLRVILSAPDSGKSLKGTADDMDGQYVRRNEIQRNKITVSNMGNVDVTGISHLGIDNDAEDDMMTGEMHRAPRNMEILSVTSSGYDENESPWEFPTSFTTDSSRGIAADSTTEVSEEFKKEAVCPVDIEGPEGSAKSLETSRVNPCKIHEAKFGASDREATADHPTAARNLALDDGDAGKRKEAVLINELNPNGAEDNAKNFAFHNQALVTDEVEETIF